MKLLTELLLDAPAPLWAAESETSVLSLYVVPKIPSYASIFQSSGVESIYQRED